MTQGRYHHAENKEKQPRDPDARLSLWRDAGLFQAALRIGTGQPHLSPDQTHLEARYGVRVQDVGRQGHQNPRFETQQNSPAAQILRRRGQLFYGDTAQLPGGLRQNCEVLLYCFFTKSASVTLSKYPLMRLSSSLQTGNVGQFAARGQAFAPPHGS